jgi:hypothetical protein
MGSKMARASAASPFVEAHNVFLPSPVLFPWVDEFLSECESFPMGAHDDQVDAFTQAVCRLMTKPGFDLADHAAQMREHDRALAAKAGLTPKLDDASYAPGQNTSKMVTFGGGNAWGG